MKSMNHKYMHLGRLADAYNANKQLPPRSRQSAMFIARQKAGVEGNVKSATLEQMDAMIAYLEGLPECGSVLESTDGRHENPGRKAGPAKKLKTQKVQMQPGSGVSRKPRKLRGAAQLQEKTGISSTSKADYQKQYRKLRAAKYVQHRAQRRAAEQRATPPWSNPKEIQEIYELAREFVDAGILVDVDHIFPLRAKSVCGLHVAANLRVCLRKNNQKKKNSVDEAFTMVILHS
jgi:hypothetical protein